MRGSMKRLTVLCMVLIGVVFMLGFPIIKATIPSGATVASSLGNETAPSDAAGSHSAFAGNISEITLTAYSTTQAWAGFYGNITGTIQLADALDDVMYNWSVTDPSGEVYAVNTSTSIDWANVQCFNFTANGSTFDDSGQAGATSLYGMNLTQIEALYNINPTDVDGFNETFDTDGSLPGNSGTHDEFYVNALNFTTGECLSANMFRKPAGSGGSGVDDYFEEVLLYDPTNVVPIFTAILENDEIAGFDTEHHNFQLMVPEDGHGTDTTTVPWYFYAEIE